MAIKLPKLILASASKVRSQILADAGVLFEVEVSNVNEGVIKATGNAQAVEEIALELAVAKAQAVSAVHPRSLVIGADQILECEGALFDKPVGIMGAVRHLETLRGKEHRLITAACVVQAGRTLWQVSDDVRLSMRDLSDDFIQSYLNQAGEGVLESVGAYRLEDLGAQLFNSVEGDFFTVLGLPLFPLLEFLRGQEILET
jgi:septum formation protein